MSMIAYLSCLLGDTTFVRSLTQVVKILRLLLRSDLTHRFDEETLTEVDIFVLKICFASLQNKLH
jgi:hypothetical protein